MWSILSINLHLYNNKIFRYIFWGTATTLVNLITYYSMRKLLGINYNVANFFSILFAIIFAYFVNSKYVFNSSVTGGLNRLKEFLKFISARLTTMLIEFFGLIFFVEILLLPDSLSKIVVQFFVLIINYIISKFLVFRN